MIDLTQSRAKCYTAKYRCYWVPRDRSGKNDNEELKHTKKRVLFFAYEVDAKALGTEAIEDAFMLPYATKTIQTTDSVEGIAKDDMVECEGEMWRVEAVRSVRLQSVSPYLEKRQTTIGLRK